MENNNQNNQFLIIPNTELNLIPYYDEVISVGITGINTKTEKPISPPTNYIDTGDFFRDATFAVRHYGENMTEYPNGYILALKEIQDIQLVVWGHDYVIETDAYRLTKKNQKSATPNHITAYSTNLAIHPDGQPIHEPIDIPIESIKKISVVIGYVVKKCGTVMSNVKKEE